MTDINVELEIPFLFPDPKEKDRACFLDFDAQAARLLERNTFWDSQTTFEWFLAKGYTLYERFGHTPVAALTYPRKQDPDSVDADYPWPTHDVPQYREANRSAYEGSGGVIFAQDAQGHHVAIKLIAKDTDALKIYQFLLNQDIDTLRENCILPILEILHTKSHCLVVMPRWGTSTIRDEPESLLEVVNVVQSLLKALTFLHRSRILHRDITFHNVLGNYFAASVDEIISQRRAQLCRNGEILYGIFDFELSMLAPADIEPSQFRLPYQYSWVGTYGIRDTTQGEPDYNPFAYDVGILGITFSYHYQTVCAHLPFLVPLFDAMTTRNISRRFTAAEALQFFNTELLRMSPTDLTLPFSPCHTPFEEGTHPHWDHLPVEVAQRWTLYKEPPVPMTTRILYWLCSYKIAKHLIVQLCKFLRPYLSAV